MAYTRQWWHSEDYTYTHDTHVAADVRNRDMRVLYDPLYPAQDRSTIANYAGIARRNFNLPTQSVDDTYRLVGYLANQSSVTPTWKLFARQLDRNRADFYAVPANGYGDIKVPITNDMIVGRDKLRDVYTIPDTMTFSSPLMESTPYTFVGLPKSDLQDLRYL
jgi:hypothetical protein